MVLTENNSGVVLKTKLVRIVSSPVFLCLLLFVTTLAAYWPATRCDFINYDDPDYFTANPHVLAGLTAANVRWAFTTGFASNWHPLTWLSLMLDAQISGKNPFVPHLMNLIFHALDAALLFLLLRKLTGALWRSALVAALFALHPLHVESVAWVAERKDVLSTCFALLSLLSYARYAQEQGERRKKKAPPPPCSLLLAPCSKSYWFALIFFALSLMAKPMLVTLPFVMLLLDWWPLQRFTIYDLRFTASRLFFEKIPFFVLSAASAVITFVVQQKGGAVEALVKLPLAARIENAFVSYACYLGKTFWPDALANPYPHPGNWEMPLVIYSVALVAGLSAMAVLFARRFPFVFTGWFWFIGTLIPVIGLVQVGDAAMADRYTYFPLIGIFIVLVWSGGFILSNCHAPNSLMIFFAAIILVACALRTRAQLACWQNSGTLFSHTLAVTENNYVAENNLGTWLSSQGKVPEAMDHFRRSLQIKADNPDALYNLGNAFAKTGDWDEAIGDYRRALQIRPDQPDILDNLGFALAAEKQFAEAITNFEAALAIKPDFAGAHNNLATVLFIGHRFAEAAQHYREAIRLEPGNAQLYANLGDTLARLGQFTETVQNYETAVRLNPDDTRTKAKLQAMGVRISN